MSSKHAAHSTFDAMDTRYPKKERALTELEAKHQKLNERSGTRSDNGACAYNSPNIIEKSQI